MKKKLIIFGNEDYAHIAYEYFTHDSRYEVQAFTVDKDYIKETSLLGIPVVAFEDVERLYPPDMHEIYVAVLYGKLNRHRAEICARAKAKKYRLASYISSRAFCWRNVTFGEHCFIFEDNTIQPFVRVGDNVIMWSGNHIGHHSHIGNNCFISSHVVVSGGCDIGDNCFIGVNTTLANNMTLGKESWVSHGAVLAGKVPPNSFVKPVQSEITALNEDALFRALARASAQRNQPPST